MQVKQTILISIFLFFSCNIMYSHDYPYKCMHESTPGEFKDLFYSALPGGKILYHGKDRYERFFIEKIPPGKSSQFYFFYKDKNGELWQSRIDYINKTETPFIYIKEPGTEDCEGFHPNELKNIHLIPKENILRHPKEMPFLYKFTVLDILCKAEQENIPNYTPKKTKAKKSNNSFSQQNNTNEYDTDHNDSNNIHDDEYEAPTTEVPTFSNGFNWQPYLISGCIATTFMISYYYALTYASECCRYLAQEDTWSSWKSEESFETLLMTQPKYLVDNLIKDIQIKYYQEPDPIKLFLKDIAEEYDTLGKWIQFRNTLRRFYLPLGKAFYTMENRLSLLNHMRKIIHYWRSQQLSIEPS